MLGGYVDSLEDATQYPFNSGMLDILIEKVRPAGYVAEGSAAFAVALTTEITPELAKKGLARELVRRIQNMRKSANFEETERIIIACESDAEIYEALRYYSQTFIVLNEVRANEIETPILFDSFPKEPGGYKETHEFDGHKVALWIRKDE